MGDIVILEEKYILEYIKTMLMEARIKPVDIRDKYHHNTSYSRAESVIRNGILTINDLNKYGITNYSKESLKIMGDISSHINGVDAVSLSVVGLTDLYENEEEYNPFSSNQVDVIVSSDISASRSTEHYGNEFLSYKSISPEAFRSIDIRLLNYIENINNCSNKLTNQLISYYNCLKNIALAMKEIRLDIPLREMSSNEDFSLDIDKLSKNERLVLKK